jgi:hypothetical protein
LFTLRSACVYFLSRPKGTRLAVSGTDEVLGAIENRIAHEIQQRPPVGFGLVGDRSGVVQ